MILKPRLVHTTFSFLPAFGGQENCILSLSLRHAAEWDVHVFANYRARAMHGDRYRVHCQWPMTVRWVESRPRLGRAFLWAQLALLQGRSRFDVWHVHFTNAFGQITAEYALRHRIPCVWGVHGIGCLRDLKSFVERRRDVIQAAPMGSLIIDAGSRFLADEIRSYGYPRSVHIPRGCDHELFRRTLPAHAGGTHRLNVIAIARNVPDKRLSLVLQVMGQLAKSGRRDIGLTVVTHECAQLSEVVARQGLQDMVRLLRTADLRGSGTFLIPLEGVVAEIKSADCMVSLSRYEASPNVLIEAFAAGIPVVVSDIPAHREMVEDGVNGLIAESDTMEEVAALLIRLSDDKALRRRLAAGAAAAGQRYDWDRTAAEYSRLYREAMEAATPCE